MASFPELGRALVDLTGTPYPTIDLIARKLRAAGLLSVKGVNRYAGAQMTSRDAATLLISLSIDRARDGDVVKEVSRVMDLPLTEAQEVGMVWPKYQTAIEALGLLIEDARLWRGELNCSINPAGSLVGISVANYGSTMKTATEAVMLTYGTPVVCHVSKCVSLNDSLFRELNKVLLSS